MMSGACARYRCGCPQTDSPNAPTHIVKLRETALDHLDGHGPAIDLQYDRIEHLLGIYLTLSVRNLTIAVRINPPKYLGRHSGTGREVNLQIHTFCVDRESRSLKIFIDTMRGGRRC